MAERATTTVNRYSVKMANSPPNESTTTPLDNNRILASSIDADSSHGNSTTTSSGRKNILWDIAKREYALRKQERARRLADRQIVLLGTRGCGKSTMLHRVSGRDDKPVESIGLEYTYVRHQLKSSLADEVVGHIWECPPTPYMAQLLKAVVNAKTLAFTSFIVCVDLSQPITIPSALECMLRYATTVIRDVVGTTDAAAAVTDSMKKRAIQRCSAAKIGETNTTTPAGDLRSLQPVLLPCWIVGCKYDKFQDYEPEKKNMITKYLRFMARMHGAGLMYFHWKSEQHTKRLKTIMMELTLPPDDDDESQQQQAATDNKNSTSAQQQGGTTTTTTTTTVGSTPPQFDYNKLVFVKPNDDDLTKLGEPPHTGSDPAGATQQHARGSTQLAEPVWRRAYETFIHPLTPALEFTQTKPDDINWSQYQESIIDKIYALKNEELSRQKLLV